MKRENTFKICLLDTCIISEFYKNPETIGKAIIKDFILDQMFFAISFETLREIITINSEKNKFIINSFFKNMAVLPTIILKNHEMLLEEEIKKYKSSDITPIYLYIPPLKNNEYYEKLKWGVMDKIKIVKSQIEENEITLKHLLSWIEGYTPKGKQYVKREIDIWVELVTTKIIAQNSPQLLKVKDFDYKWFKSVNSLSYMTFYKFYFKHRKPRVSDVPDIAMSGIFPYVDIFITEKDMAETIRQLQKKHDFLTNLEVYSINDLR